MEELLLQFSGLVGYAAFVVFIVNLLKGFGVVKDGQSQNWIAGFNLLGLIGLFAIHVFMPETDISAIDVQIGKFVEFALYLLAYIAQMLGSKVTYIAVRNVPVIGKSFSASE